MADADRPRGGRGRAGGERAAIVAVPLLPFALDAASRVVRGWPTELLLVPPLAVVPHLPFSEPGRADARHCARCAQERQEHGGPQPGALACAALGSPALGSRLLAVLLARRAIRARRSPALASAVLAALLRVRGPWCPLDVAVSSLVVWGAFRAWRRATA